MFIILLCVWAFLNLYKILTINFSTKHTISFSETASWFSFIQWHALNFSHYGLTLNGDTLEIEVHKPFRGEAGHMQLFWMGVHMFHQGTRLWNGRISEPPGQCSVATKQKSQFKMEMMVILSTLHTLAVFRISKPLYIWAVEGPVS